MDLDGLSPHAPALGHSCCLACSALVVRALVPTLRVCMRSIVTEGSLSRYDPYRAYPVSGRACCSPPLAVATRNFLLRSIAEEIYCDREPEFSFAKENQKWEVAHSFSLLCTSNFLSYISLNTIVYIICIDSIMSEEISTLY